MERNLVKSVVRMSIFVKRGWMMENSLIFSPFELKIYIEYLRIDLIDKGQQLGLINEVTVEASQELDYFIYQYQLLTGSKNFPEVSAASF
ncbi:aspartyl-phosphate phosphatase Spo0E family protein [Neobacillus terrae]|uniref:aspartyl-phosphate phosphatase Spo0E family protein n=1 Tax=Neobacillus terrae TaxID=3034837 RepID=UPI0014086506|nr:aspartyl-phosphate phosphatase Spo0E family protein [Neobacillus terrae]NHM29896.1 aspartyl-phosphate phosphatase Spo0E family protein [Neobacillus terrae]